jgi:MscS family membrane protein
MLFDPFPYDVQAGECARFDGASARVRCLGFLVLVSVLSAGSTFAQQKLLKTGPSQAAAPQTAPTPTPQETPKDPFGRDTPYSTVAGFLKATERGDWQRAAEFLDSKQPLAQKQELARQLKLVMDRGLALDLEKVSKNPLGSPTEKWRATRNEIGTAHIGDQSLDILLDLIQPTRKAPPYWLFASETLVGVPDLARDLEEPWFEKYIPEALLENQVLEVPLFRWITTPLLIGVGFALVWLVTWLLRLGAEWILRKTQRRNVTLLRSRFLGSVRMLILAYLVYAAAPVAPTLVMRQMWRHIAVAVTIAGVGWLLACTLGLAEKIAEARFRRQNSLSKIAPLQLSVWVMRAFVAVGTLVATLYAVGINPTAVVTGLGLGGIALAFAAQKTIENVFGTIMIVVDQPVRVGDFCKIGDAVGTIEEIGLRSTRVRTLDRTVLTVPNGQLASMTLENFSSRDRIWFRHIIGLRYETTADQLRIVLEGIRSYLKTHPKVDPDPSATRVRFIRFGGSSLDLEVFTYVIGNDFLVFLEVQEELLLRIMDIIAGAGTGVALPSQITYLAKDRGSDAEKSRAAVEQVREQRNSAVAS